MVILMPKSKKKIAERKVVTSTQAAETLGVSKPVLLDYVRRGWLQGYKKGLGVTSTVMIYVDSLEKFIQDREIGK